MKASGDFRSGYIAIIGRPNAGKSTLLNAMLGEKVSVVTSRPQTTVRRLLGIRTTQDSQMVFIDTPGIHKPLHKLGDFMVREAKAALGDSDIILLMVEPFPSGPENKYIINMLGSAAQGCRVLLLINKTDLVKKAELLPVIEEYSKLYDFDMILPMSALNPSDVDMLLAGLEQRLPQGPKYYPDEVLTDQYERAVVCDIVREKIMEATQAEIPHSAAVDVIEWKEREDGLVSISINIYVEREGQKGIIIGKRGGMLKLIGAAARADMERLLGRKVFLQLWVKVRKNWRSDDAFLKEMGLK